MSLTTVYIINVNQRQYDIVSIVTINSRLYRVAAKRRNSVMYVYGCRGAFSRRRNPRGCKCCFIAPFARGEKIETTANVPVVRVVTTTAVEYVLGPNNGADSTEEHPLDFCFLIILLSLSTRL